MDRLRNWQGFFYPLFTVGIKAYPLYNRKNNILDLHFMFTSNLFNTKIIFTNRKNKKLAEYFTNKTKHNNKEEETLLSANRYKLHTSTTATVAGG